MTSSPSRIRDRVAFAATTALLLVSACGGGSEPVSHGRQPPRDVPPAVRDSPGATREPPGATREAPGPGRQPPSGGGAGTPGTTTACLECPHTYICTLTSSGQTRDLTLDLESSGGECSLSGTTGTAVFHCDGTLTLTGDSVGSASRWHTTRDGGFVVDGTDAVIRCSPPAAPPRTTVR